jgi:hypothetical protein
MAFEHDFLISYAHIDNEALIAGDHGWISELHRLLEIRVGQVRGQKPKIWRDQKLQGNDVFADTILERLPRIAALVSVLSPRYVQSEWCNRELKEFYRQAELSGGARIGDKARIFKVVKTPVSSERLPEEVQPMLGYDFFVYDEAGRPRELSRDYGTERAFLTKLDDLAFDIAQLLDLIDNNAVSVAPAAPKGTLFLAETSFELREEREAIKRELVRNGYEVLPDRALPLVGPELDAIVREQLERSKISIHLVGLNYGIVPEGATVSIVERQQALASEAAPGTDLLSIIWVRPGMEIKDERQQTFVRSLQTSPLVHATAELLEVPIEELKAFIYRKLTPPPTVVVKAAAVAPSEQEHPRLYLLCDQQDVTAAQSLEDHLFSEGFEVVLPFFDEDETQARLEHEENLRSCDVILLYYGSGDELWLRRKLRELQKSAALGRERPLLARAIYVGAPATPQKERFRTHEAMLIHEPAGGFDPSLLAPLLDAIAKAREPAS